MTIKIIEDTAFKDPDMVTAFEVMLRHEGLRFEKEVNPKLVSELGRGDRSPFVLIIGQTDTNIRLNHYSKLCKWLDENGLFRC